MSSVPIFLSLLWVWQTLGLSPRSCLQVYEDSNLSSAPAVPFLGHRWHEFPGLSLSYKWWTSLISNHEGSTPSFSFVTTQYVGFFWFFSGSGKITKHSFPKEKRLQRFYPCYSPTLEDERHKEMLLGDHTWYPRIQLLALTLVCHSSKLPVAETR